MHRLRRSAVHAALCAVALLVQATVLPLAHSRHARAAACDQHGVGVAVAQAHGAAALRDAAAVPAAHDAADCALCATAAHSRAGVVPAVLSVPLAPRALSLTEPAVRTDEGRLAYAPGGPRAPPALSA